MKYPLSLRCGLLALSLSVATLPAWADDDCDAPVERWQSREAVRQMAVREGWQIQRLKIDDGCYEIRGTDAQGRSFKATLDPETLAVLKIRQADASRERARDRESHGAGRPALGSPSDAASGPSPAEPAPRKSAPRKR